MSMSTPRLVYSANNLEITAVVSPADHAPGDSVTMTLTMTYAGAEVALAGGAAQVMSGPAAGQAGIAARGELAPEVAWGGRWLLGIIGQAVEIADRKAGRDQNAELRREVAVVSEWLRGQFAVCDPFPDDIRAKVKARAAELNTSEAGVVRDIVADHFNG